MNRSRHMLRIAVFAFYVLQAGVLIPLHMFEEAPAASLAAPAALAAPCDPGLPCGNPDHHHHRADARHQPDHCPACTFALRGAVIAVTPRLTNPLAILGAVWLRAEGRLAARALERHAPRGPPALVA